MDLAAARQEGFVSKEHLENDGTHSKKKLLAVIGIITTFGRKTNRDAIRKAWMQSGNAPSIFYLFNLLACDSGYINFISLSLYLYWG